ncbi:hypothetical protein F1737_02980 [Methanoplanus sp. FWC-SCC4]|uniref:2-phospho-L-lactate transferase n=1 Tax=Methanochimaera problematica TaxID=2609417 RepID=A0AA97FE08_9EURY|nr:2-phospho-L-lactate transferase CofD family protein [Methanoplanus sp. FWC-SCC4]WOF15726.1 hypothetical protein F1737_02980 [Methanoplanus sp. FWC-SCC4]
MITFISGGPESLKLIRAFRTIHYDNEISVIANTSDNIWMSGNLVSPDLYDLIFLFSGILNTAKWSGIKGDTYSTGNFLTKIHRDEFYPVGDKERSLHIAISDLLRDKKNLTQASEILCQNLKITSKILPVSNSRYSSYVSVDEETMHVLEFRQRFKEDRDMENRASVNLDFFKKPIITKDVSDIIKQSDAVIVGPGRFNTTISPILACEGMIKALKNSFTIAFPPDLPEDFCTDKYPSLLKITEKYNSFSDISVKNIREDKTEKDVIYLDTTLSSRNRAESLAWDLLSVIRSQSH